MKTGIQTKLISVLDSLYKKVALQSPSLKSEYENNVL